MRVVSLGKNADGSVPIICRTVCAGVSSAVGPVITRFPERRMVTSSPNPKISSMKWLMKRIATPCPLRRSTISNNRSTSRLEIVEVGSSMTNTLASIDSAFAISTACRSAILNNFTGKPGSISICSPASSSCARRVIAVQSIPLTPRGCRPMKTFSATERSGNTAGC